MSSKPQSPNKPPVVARPPPPPQERIAGPSKPRVNTPPKAPPKAAPKIASKSGSKAVSKVVPRVAARVISKAVSKAAPPRAPKRSPDAKNRTYVDGKPHWIISRIAGVRKNGPADGLIYHVEWTGYSKSTWEPEEHCHRGAQKIIQFFKNITNAESRDDFQRLSKIPEVRNYIFGKEQKLVAPPVKRKGSAAARTTKRAKIATKLTKGISKIKKQLKKKTEKKKTVKRAGKSGHVGGAKSAAKRRMTKPVKPAK